MFVLAQLLDHERPGGWKIGAPLPVPRLESAGAVINGKLYVFGGFTLGLRAVKRVDVYDPFSDRWTQVADMPTPVTHVNAAVDGQVAWFAGGFVGDHPGAATNQVWQYDAVADRWREGTALPAKRSGGSLQRLGRSLHYFGGFAEDRDTTCADHWTLSLDHAQEWVESVPLPDARGHLAGIVLGDKMYALGGQYRHDTKPKDVASVHVYDDIQNQWSELTSLPEPRSHFEPGTFAINNKILIVGGRNNHKRRENNKNFFQHKQDRAIDDLPHRLWRKLNHHFNDDFLSSAITVYDPDTNIWSDLSSLPLHLLAPVSGAIQNRLVVTGGGKNWVTNPQPRTFFNQTLLELVCPD